MKIPLFSYNPFQESWISTRRDSIDIIEGAHNTAGITLFNTHLKRTKKRFRHILLRHLQKSIHARVLDKVFNINI